MPNLTKIKKYPIFCYFWPIFGGEFSARKVEKVTQEGLCHLLPLREP